MVPLMIIETQDIYVYESSKRNGIREKTFKALPHNKYCEKTTKMKSVKNQTM